jgi:hypothetical protein
MSLPDVWDLFEHWREYPPAHILLRGYVGYEPPGKSGEPNETEQRLLAQSSVIGSTKRFSELPQEVRDRIAQEQ